MMLAELLNLILLALLGGLGVWFSLAAKRYNDLTAEQERRREERERKHSYELDRDRFEEVSADVGLRLLRTLHAGEPFPTFTDMLRKPPIWPDSADDSSQFAAKSVYANQPSGAIPKARTFPVDATTAVEAIDIALYSSGGHQLLTDDSWLDRVVLGQPRTPGPHGGPPDSDTYRNPRYWRSGCRCGRKRAPPRAPEGGHPRGQHPIRRDKQWQMPHPLKSSTASSPR